MDAEQRSRAGIDAEQPRLTVRMRNDSSHDLRCGSRRAGRTNAKPQGWLIRMLITNARCYERRSGSLADTAADRKRLPILVHISIRGRSADWHKYKRTSEGTDKPSLSVGPE